MTINFVESLAFSEKRFIIASPIELPANFRNFSKPLLKIFLYPYSTDFFIAYWETVLAISLVIIFTNSTWGDATEGPIIICKTNFP